MNATLHAVDWAVIGIYGVFALALGLFFVKRASTSTTSYFVGDKNLPWWLAGTSIIATTFAADTPLAITGIVAIGGISGNWLWWCWGIAHLTATFFFAKMWRRSGVLTDAEIIELRYSGKAAAVLRGFKAIYFGIFINCLTMAWVIKAMVKISAAFFDANPVIVVAVCVGFSVAYTVLGGFRSVVLTDMVQLILGMTGAIVLAWFVVVDFGGMAQMLEQLGAVLSQGGAQLNNTLDFIPSIDHPQTPVAYFIVLLVAGWWRMAEGNGYIVQRLAACRTERDAKAASLWFAVGHNALRPWPWIVVALGALIVFPDLPDKEMGYPMMMGRYLPPGVLGLVVASLLAAFMSTIDTHTNWGASYLVRDVYQRFINPDAHERHYVWVARGCIVLMACLAGLASMWIQNISDVWKFLVALGAGLGSVTAARWYWSRVTAYAEFTALGVTTVVSIALQAFFSPNLFGAPNPWMIANIPTWQHIIIIAAMSLATWVPMALWGPQNSTQTLEKFVARVRPPAWGWGGIKGTDQAPLWPLAVQTLGGGIVVFGTLLGVGWLVLGPIWQGVVMLCVVLLVLHQLLRRW